MAKPWFILTRRAGTQRRRGTTDPADPASMEGPADAIVRLFRGEDVLSTFGSSLGAEAPEQGGPSHRLPRCPRRSI